MHFLLLAVAIANSVTWVLSDEGVLFTTYNIDSYNETELSLIMKHLHEDVMDGTLNITMICHIQPCLAVLKSVCILWNDKRSFFH